MFQSRTQFGLLLIHLGLDSPSADVRRSTNALICRATVHHPKLTNLIIRESLAAFLLRGPPVQPSTSPDDSPVQWNKHARLVALLLSAASFAEEVESSVREEVVVQLIVLVHHDLICKPVLGAKYDFLTTLQVALTVRHGSTFVKKQD